MAIDDIEEMDDTGGLEVPDESGAIDYRADWKIFLPTLVILIGYGLSLLYLWATGRSDSALFRLGALVAGIGGPLLAAHAFLRFETICVRLMSDRIRLHRGWPKSTATEIPYEMITDMKIRRGLFGRLLGIGTLVIQARGGSRIAVGDLKQPEAILTAYDKMQT